MSKKNSSAYGPDALVQSAHVNDASLSPGKPLLLDIAMIDPDPNQPRQADNPGFSQQSLKELADTIALRGVKMPISVRENPAKPGRYIINHGERRWRGSQVAGKTHIPAFIDNDYSDDDQVIENIQRNDLTAREVAVHIGRKLASGLTKSQIAKSLGKSPAFVTQHAALLDLPDCIADAFNQGLIRDVTVVNELVTAYKQDAGEVKKLLQENEGEDITRSAVKVFREFLDEKESNRQDFNAIEAFNSFADDQSLPHTAEEHELADPTEDARDEPERVVKRGKLKKARLVVDYEGEQGCIVLTRLPSERGKAWIKFDRSGREEELNLKDVRIICLTEE